MPEEYNPFEAARVAYATLAPDLRAVLSEEDVLHILYLEFQYYQTAAVRPAEIGVRIQNTLPSDLELMVAFVSGESKKQGRSYSAEQVAHVLKGEDLYMRQIGLIEDEPQDDTDGRTTH